MYNWIRCVLEISHCSVTISVMGWRDPQHDGDLIQTLNTYVITASICEYVVGLISSKSNTIPAYDAIGNHVNVGNA